MVYEKSVTIIFTPSLFWCPTGTSWAKVHQSGWWCTARRPLSSWQILSHSENPSMRYLLPKFVDFADGVTDRHTDTNHHRNRFTALFPGWPSWAGDVRELLNFMVQGKIYTGRHTDYLAGCHSIRTNQCPPPSSPIFYRPDALPAAQPTVSKHWRQQTRQHRHKNKQ